MMSYSTFLASDTPMPDMKNPHEQFLSVNEALAKGIEMSNLVLDSATIDRDEPGVILWFDNEDNLGEITIRSTEQPYHFTDDYGNPPDTALKCLSSLEWKYTDERANKLIGYIRKHLETATVLEVWNTWIGGGRDFSKGTKKYNVGINELSLVDLEKLFAYDSNEQYDCIAVRRA
jgi:hypothetical protein